MHKMKFIHSANIKGNIGDSVLFLRENGILASDAADYGNAPTYSMAAKNIKQGIWVHLNHQYADAIAVLHDKSHVVKTKLTEEEMQKIEASAKNLFFNLSTQFFGFLAKGIFYLGLIGIIALMVYKAVNA
jgi:hypothetical protein